MIIGDVMEEFSCGVCSDTGLTGDGRFCGHCLEGRIKILTSRAERAEAKLKAIGELETHCPGDWPDMIKREDIQKILEETK